MTAKNPVLYGDEASPPVRFVMMTASFLNIDIDFHKVDLFKSEHKTDFFTKINPLQKVPALFDGSNIICDSHAIALYLCRKCNDDELYPQDNLRLKSRIDEMLFFNCSILFPIDKFIFSEFFMGKWPANDIQLQNWYSALDYLEHRLNQYNWLSGNKMQLCDLCCATTVSSLNILIPTLERHIKVKEWMKKLDSSPFYYDINSLGIKRLKCFVHKEKNKLLNE